MYKLPMLQQHQTLPGEGFIIASQGLNAFSAVLVNFMGKWRKKWDLTETGDQRVDGNHKMSSSIVERQGKSA